MAKRKRLAVVMVLLVIGGAAVWWTILRPSKPRLAETEMESLLPDHTPPIGEDSRPLILSPSVALHQEGQEHTVEFRVRAAGLHLDDKQQFAGVTLMDGPGTREEPQSRDMYTICVFVPPSLVEEFRTRTSRELDRYLIDKTVRVRGRITRERLSFEATDGHLVQHARVRIDLTGLDRIGVVPATTQPGSGRAVVARQDEARAARKVAASHGLLNKPAPLLDVSRWFNGTGPTGGEHAAGKVVLLDFWGQWCGPCVRKLPRVQELHDKYKDRGLVVVGVHTPDGSEKLADFLDRQKVTFPVALDTGRTAERFGVEAWPTYYLIDKVGLLAWGFNNTPPSDAQVEALLGR